MKRYNLGFKWFGPLEQCKDGTLVKYEDHIHLLFQFVNKKNKKIKELEDLLEQETRKQWLSILQINKIEKQNITLFWICSILMLGNLIHLFTFLQG
jgi:hypothetical protein